MYKETISIEMQLKRITIENPEYGELWSTWNLNKKTLEPILNAIIKDYPHYSLHDHSHSESILSNIERVLGNGNIENLSPTDLWLLLHVAYLHDFGMVIVDIKIHELWSAPEFQEFLKVQQDSTNEDLKKAAEIISSSNKSQEIYDSSWPLEVKSAVTLLTSQYCRGKHAAYSRDYILDINNIWGIDLGHNGLIKHRFLSLLADISAIHTKPFESNCIVLYKIIEAIFQECDSSLFEISVISKNIDFEENISATVSNKSGFPSELLEAGELYKLSQDNGEITCWYNNNLYKIAIDKKSRGKVAVKFKGKNVQKSKINTFRYQGFKIEVDIYGIATKEALNLSREELTYQASKKVEEDINHIIKTYLDLLEQNAKAIKENTNLVDTLLLSMWLYKKNFPDSLHTSVSGEKNIRAVRYDKVEKGYKAVNCSLSDIVGCFPELPCINCEIRKLSSMHGQDLTEEEFIKGLNASNIDKSGCYQLIIIDDDLKRFLSHGPCDITYLEFGDNIWLYTARTDDRLYNPDKYTRQILIRNLVFDDTDDTRMISSNAMNTMRRAMPAFEEFSGLAVDLKYIPFIRAEGRSKWNIISPISLEDSKKIEGFSKEAFIDFIVSQTVFSNLVDYVAEHGKSESSRETIISEYKRLIEAYYELETSSDRAST